MPDKQRASRANGVGHEMLGMALTKGATFVFVAAEKLLLEVERQRMEQNVEEKVTASTICCPFAAGIALITVALPLRSIKNKQLWELGLAHALIICRHQYVRASTCACFLSVISFFVRNEGLAMG